MPTPEQPKPSERTISRRTAYSLSFCVVLGIALMFLGAYWDWKEQWHSVAAASLGEIGILTAVIFGTTLLHEQFLREEAVNETIRIIEGKVPQIAETVAAHVRLRGGGLRLLTTNRRSWPGYTDWVEGPKKQRILIAGRAVLDKVTEGLTDRNPKPHYSLAQAIMKRLREGDHITIIMLDPELDAIPELAAAENRTANHLLGEIKNSLAACEKLVEPIWKERESLPPSAFLTVRACKHDPCFSYHRVGQMRVVGFYFRNWVGGDSPAYQVEGEETQAYFDNHFNSLCESHETSTLIEFNGNCRPTTRSELERTDVFHRLKNYLDKKNCMTKAEEPQLGGGGLSTTEADAD